MAIVACPTTVVAAPAERVWELIVSPASLAEWTETKLRSGPAAACGRPRRLRSRRRPTRRLRRPRSRAAADLPRRRDHVLRRRESRGHPALEGRRESLPRHLQLRLPLPVRLAGMALRAAPGRTLRERSGGVARAAQGDGGEGTELTMEFGSHAFRRILSRSRGRGLAGGARGSGASLGSTTTSKSAWSNGRPGAGARSTRRSRRPRRSNVRAR
jgi:hypothetical protein